MSLCVCHSDIQSSFYLFGFINLPVVFSVFNNESAFIAVLIFMRRIWSVEELKTLCANRKLWISHYWFPWQSTVKQFKTMKWEHCQSDKHHFCSRFNLWYNLCHPVTFLVNIILYSSWQEIKVVIQSQNKAQLNIELYIHSILIIQSHETHTHTHTETHTHTDTHTHTHTHTDRHRVRERPTHTHSHPLMTHVSQAVQITVLVKS